MLDIMSPQQTRYYIPALGRLYDSLSDLAWLALRVTVGVRSGSCHRPVVALRYDSRC